MGKKSGNKSDPKGSAQGDPHQTTLFGESTGTQDSHDRRVTPAAPSPTEPTDAHATPFPDGSRETAAESAPTVSETEVNPSGPAPHRAGNERTLKTSTATSGPDKKRDKKLLKQKANGKVSGSPEEPLECGKPKGRETVEISPTSIVVEDSVEALMSNKLTGLFKLRLPLLQKGAKRFADMLRIHVIKRKHEHVCVGGYIALKVILASENPPTAIVADLHTRVTKVDIAEWATTESRLIPLIFRLQQEQEDTEEIASDGSDLFAYAKTGHKRTRRDEAFFESLVETFESDLGRQLIREPANNEEWAETLRVSERTISTRMQKKKHK